MIQRTHKRELEIVAGLPQEGKSYYVENKAELYARNKGVAFAYNVGKPEDFKDFRLITFLEKSETLNILTAQENKRIKNAKAAKFSKAQLDTLEDNKKEVLSMYKNDPKPLYFRDEKTQEIYEIENILRFANKHERKIKSYRPSREIELKLFETFYHYMSNVYLIIDDCRALYRNGLQSNDVQTFSRLNHSGIKLPPHLNGKGIDCSIIFHNLDKVNSEFFDYATTITLFKCNQEPKYSTIENKSVIPYINKAFTTLLNAPRYTRVKIQVTPLLYNDTSREIKLYIFKPN